MRYSYDSNRPLGGEVLLVGHDTEWVDQRTPEAKVEGRHSARLGGPRSAVVDPSVLWTTAGDVSEYLGVETMSFAYNESSLSSMCGNQP